jgi:multidrug efflux pump subunit AcrA (membrane-fusion protein)
MIIKKSGFLWMVTALLLLTASCHRQEPVRSTRKAVKIAVKTASVARGDLQDTLHIYGEVKARHVVGLASQFDGRLTAFSLLEGDRVIRHEKVAVIVPPLREALLQVMDKVPASERSSLSQEIKEIPLYSPAHGVVLQVFHRNGDVVQKGEPLAQVADLKQLDVYADLPVQYLPLARRLKTIRLQFINYPHAPMSLPVSAFAGKVNTTEQTIAMRIALANPREAFRPGMRVLLSFPAVKHKNTLLIPRSALLEQEGNFHVFVVKNGTAIQRKVTVGIRQDQLVEILSGLKAGEKVVTDKAYSLTDGMKVKGN